MRSTKEQYITNKEGNKVAVIIPIKDYEQLLEDLHDLAIVAERKNEEVISFKEMQKRLKEDGKL